MCKNNKRIVYILTKPKFPPPIRKGWFIYNNKPHKERKKNLSLCK